MRKLTRDIVKSVAYISKEALDTTRKPNHFLEHLHKDEPPEPLALTNQTNQTKQTRVTKTQGARNGLSIATNQRMSGVYENRQLQLA